MKMYAFPNQNASVRWGLTPSRFFRNFFITLFRLRLLGTQANILSSSDEYVSLI